MSPSSSGQDAESSARKRSVRFQPGTPIPALLPRKQRKRTALPPGVTDADIKSMRELYEAYANARHFGSPAALAKKFEIPVWQVMELINHGPVGVADAETASRKSKRARGAPAARPNANATPGRTSAHTDAV